jgi:hypothetical protein
MVESPGRHFSRFLLPHPLQKIGVMLAVAGLVWVYLRFGAGFKPSFLNWKVFAFYSTYFDTKYFRVIDNHVGEEIGGLMVIIGLFLAAFSREKNEYEGLWNFRVTALLVTSYASVAFLILAFLFVYGLAFFNVLSVYMIIPALVYLAVFRFLIFKNRRNLSE